MKNKVVLITGMSGAGKSIASSVLEDMGYHCIDQFPVQLLSAFVDMIQVTTDPRYQYIALSTSAKDFPEFIQILSGADTDIQVLFLDAANDELLHRYKSTRRTHPLLISNVTTTLEEAIQIERQMFLNYKDKATLIIDTTFLKSGELKEKVEKHFSVNNKPAFTISFISFGFKHGVPMDADLVFDVRFLPNPFWDIELRPYSGNNEKVYNYVMDKEETKTFISKLNTFLDYGLQQYSKEGKNHFTIAIGCTGGQHRSVSITNYLFDRYSQIYNSFKEHRDVVEKKDED